MTISSVIPPQQRGMVNDDVHAYYKKETGRELITRELRLLPFIQYTVMNGGTIRFDRQAISYEELRILYSMDAEGLVVLKPAQEKPNVYELGMTDHFWPIINYVLLQTYVVKGVHHAEVN